MTKRVRKNLFSLFILLLVSMDLHASAAPVLNFSDLISGPSVGLGDGKGSGVIVTVWGHNLGSSKDHSSISFIDSEGNEKPVAYIYYWKNADGKLPGGPSNLYESHKMQEIAFSIPDSPVGPGTIKVVVNEKSSTLPFSVRNGNIYHIMPTGNDSTGDGSFNHPWLTIAKADGPTGAKAGDTLYIHDVITGDHMTDMAIYNNNIETSSGIDAQFSYIAYPNSRPEAIGARTFNNWLSVGAVEGLVMSKFGLFAANADTNINDLPINVRFLGTEGVKGSANGRFVGNFITDEHSSDPNGACPDSQSAAITGGAQGRDQVSNWKVLGNYIYEYGCSGTNRQHHTTYFTIRSADANYQLASPEIAYNYLKNNKASGGLHYFDENHAGVLCGNFVTPFKVHNNVVINQVGPGLANYAKCPTDTVFEYYNNLVINAGVYPENNALLSDNTKKLTNFGMVQIGQSYGEDASTATLNFYNNTFIGWDQSNQNTNSACIDLGGREATIAVNWNNNICITDLDKKYMSSDYQGKIIESVVSGSGNVWFSFAQTKENSVTPSWDNSPITSDPLISRVGSQINLSILSPIKNLSVGELKYDIYGISREGVNAIGSVTAIDKIKSVPSQPANLTARPVSKLGK